MALRLVAPRTVGSRISRLAILAVLVISMIPVAAAPAVAAGSTFWVDAATGNDANSGTEAAPFKSLQEAAYRTGAADTVMVRPGTYDASGGINIVGQTLISTGGAAVTILQGDGDSPILIWTSLVTGGDRIQGFTFNNGGDSFSPALEVFAPLEAPATNPLIVANNVFSNNHGGTRGTALLVGGYYGSAVRVEGNTFVDNAGPSGAAIMAYQDMTLDIVNNTFQGNTAQQGGALWLRTGTFSIRGNTFTGNAATGGAASGGAIWWESGSGTGARTMEDNLFDGCVADMNGGAVYLKNLTAAFRRNRVKNCSAASGGAIYLSAANLTSEANYFKGNAASSHGSAWFVDGSSNVEERNDTLTDHVTGPEVAYCLSGAWLVVRNSVYWNPVAAAELIKAMGVAHSCTSDYATQLTTNDCNLGPGMLYTDPLFDAAGAPKLQATSPCIDAGNSGAGWYPALDLYKTQLPQDGNGDGAAAPDMGCYERVDATRRLCPVYRFYNVRSGTHFYTDSASEADHVRATWPKIFNYEGIAYYTNPANNKQPLTRLYNMGNGSHFYTADPSEATYALATWPRTFSLDGLTYAVNSTPVPISVPVYRFYNKQNSSHFYTASEEERLQVIAKWSNVYNYEGPAFWVGQ